MSSIKELLKAFKDDMARNPIPATKERNNTSSYPKGSFGKNYESFPPQEGEPVKTKRKYLSKLSRKLTRHADRSPGIIDIYMTDRSYPNYRRNRKRRRENPNIRQIKKGRIIKRW